MQIAPKLEKNGFWTSKYQIVKKKKSKLEIIHAGHDNFLYRRTWQKITKKMSIQANVQYRMKAESRLGEILCVKDFSNILPLPMLERNYNWKDKLV
jgi:hypothetical protein